MRVLQNAERLSGTVHSERGILASSDSVERILFALSATLAFGVLAETLLFRIFSRTGIYLFNDETPRWVYDGYKAAVWLGNTSYNFSSILSFLLLTALAAYLWTRRHSVGRFLPVATGVIVPWNLALLVSSPGPLAALLYIAVSASIVVAATIVVCTRAPAINRVPMALLAGSFLCAYYFETIAPLRQLGINFADRGLFVFQFGEILVGLAILAAFLAWGRTRRWQLIAGPAILGILLAVAYLSGPERLPLISTWALGVTMNLPFIVYAMGLVLLGVTILKLLRGDGRLLGISLMILLLAHRMMPLTYFNILILLGFLLLTFYFVSEGGHPAESSDVEKTGGDSYAVQNGTSRIDNHSGDRLARLRGR